MARSAWSPKFDTCDIGCRLLAVQRTVASDQTSSALTPTLQPSALRRCGAQMRCHPGLLAPSANIEARRQKQQCPQPPIPDQARATHRRLPRPGRSLSPREPIDLIAPISSIRKNKTPPTPQPRRAFGAATSATPWKYGSLLAIILNFRQASRVSQSPRSGRNERSARRTAHRPVDRRRTTASSIAKPAAPLTREMWPLHNPRFRFQVYQVTFRLSAA
jgi:hypothetical protein